MVIDGRCSTWRWGTLWVWRTGHRFMSDKAVGVMVLIMAAGLPLGCESDPVAHGKAHVLPARVVLVEVPVPPGLDVQAVTPHRGKELQQARQSLEQILNALPRPSFLPPPGGGEAAVPGAGVEPEAGGAQPPLATQRSYLAGRQAWRHGQNFEAIGHLQAALQVSPHSAEVLRLLGKIYTQSGNRIRGAIYLEKAVALDPNDTDGLFLLGRLLGEQGRWSDSVATFAYASRMGGEQTDPVLASLIQYYLGHALAHEGYDAAAVAQLVGHVDRPVRFDRTTRLVRQLVLLGRQRGATWQAIGDAYNRLGRTAEALDAYQKAVDLDMDLSGGLVRRLVWTGLRLGRSPFVLDVVRRYMEHAGADAVSMELVRYLSDQEIDRGQLAAVLRRVYDGGEHPSLLAVTIAHWMDGADAHAFLVTHLQTRPADRLAFERLVALQLPSTEKARGNRLVGVIETAVFLIDQLPSAASEYISILVDAAGDGTALIDAIDAMPVDERRLPVVRLIKGRALARADRADEAIALLEQAMNDGAGFLALRIELARLLVDRDQFARAGELLDALPAHTELSAVQLRLRVLLRQGQTAQALRYLNDLLADRPANTVDLVIEKAKLQLMTGDPTQAHETLQQALDTHPLEPRLYGELIQIYRSNQLPESQKHYQDLARRMFKAIPHERVARIERARLWVSGGQYDQAEPLLRKLLVDQPDDLDLLDPLLTLLEQTEQLTEAEAMIGQRLAANPTDRRLLGVALKHYRRIDDRPKVIDVAHRLSVDLLSDKPRDLASLGFLMEILSESGKQDMVQTLLDQHLADTPGDRVLLMLARRHYQRIDDKTRLLEVTEQLLLLGKPGVERDRSLAALYLHQDRPEKAVRVLTQALERPQPKADDCRLLVSLLTQAFVKMGRADQVDSQYQDAIKRFPDHAEDLTFDWAMQCERRGDWQSAEKILTDLLKAHPAHVLANNALGYAWADRGKHLDRAEAMIRLAVDTDPGSAAYLDSMGWVLYKLGRFKESLTWLQRAVAAPGGEYPVILNHLGDALYRLDQTKPAVAAWRRVQLSLGKHDITEDPEFDGMAQRLLEKIDAVQANQQPNVAPSPGLAQPQPVEPAEGMPPVDVRPPGEAGPVGVGEPLAVP